MSEIWAHGGNATPPRKPWHSDAYVAHLASPEWKELRIRIMRRAGGRCEHCGQADAIDVHHLTYERLGHEDPADVMAVCRPCHGILDDKLRQDAERRRRAYEQRRQREIEEQAATEAMYAANRERWQWEAEERDRKRKYETELDRWASDKRRYGTTWKLLPDDIQQRIAREFDAWLKERADYYSKVGV